MRKYGYLQGIVMSFYSRDFYRDVAQRWGAGVFLYLLLIIAISCIGLTVYLQKNMNATYIDFSEQLFPQIPVMSFKSGELSTPEKRPYEIVDSKKNPIIIIDVSGKYQNVDNTSAGILLTKQAILFKEDKSEDKKFYNYPASMTMQIDPHQVQHSLGKLINWAWIILFPLLLILFFIYRVFIIVLYAVLGKLFALMTSTPLTYPEVFEIAAVAWTPSIILETIFRGFHVSFPHLWIGYFVLSMAYLVFGILANKPITKSIKKHQ